MTNDEALKLAFKYMPKGAMGRPCDEWVASIQEAYDKGVEDCRLKTYAEQLTNYGEA